MSPSEKISKKRINLIWAFGLVISIVAVWIAFLTHSPKTEKKEVVNQPNAIEPDKSLKQSNPAKSGQVTTRSPSAKDSVSAQANPPSHFDSSMTKVGNLIANRALSHDQIASQLAQIALDPNISEAEKLEAMEHGKNLGFSHFLPLSMDPNLPILLAESYLNGLHRHHQIKDQVTGTLGLLNHSDSEIRQRAQIFLGFLLRAEEDIESPEKLREKADVFLKHPDEMC